MDAKFIIMHYLSNNYTFFYLHRYLKTPNQIRRKHDFDPDEDFA
jgi:hypothetical protein